MSGKAAFVLFISLASLAAYAQELEPSEPDIVLPQIILEIDDMSVEKIEAALPPEEELLPPLRDIPLPAPGEIDVDDTAIIPAISGTEQAASASGGLSADALFGIGMENTVLGKLSVKTLGTTPRLSFSFSHDAADGFSGNAAGSGFDSRTEALSGGLAAVLGPLDAAFKGNYREDEFGLQGQSAGYTSRTSRGADADVDFSFKPADWFTFGTGLGAGTDTFTLNGAVPRSILEYRIAPRLSAEARFKPVRIGLSSAYSYRWADFGGGSLQEMHRVRTTLSAGVELPASLFLEGSVAWLWSTSAAPNLFPFELRFSGTPFGFLTFSAGGGFAAAAYDAGSLLSAYRLVLPGGPLSDDAGWFADVSFSLSPAKDLILNAKAAFSESTAMPDSAAMPNVNPATGLYDLFQRGGYRLSHDVGLQWNAVPGVTLGGSWRHEYLDRPAFLPIDEIKAEGIAMEPSGAFGGSFSAAYRTGNTPVQLPVLNVGGFVRASPSVQLKLDFEDVLQPALGGPRQGMSPYVDSGFRIIARAQVSF